MSETGRTHYFYFYYREKASEKRLKNRRATCDKVKFRVDANIFKLSKFIGLGFEVTNDSRAKEARRKTGKEMEMEEGRGKAASARMKPRNCK